MCVSPQRATESPYLASVVNHVSCEVHWGPVYSPPMHAAVAALSVLFNNGLVIWGLGWAGWSGPTALAIYWAENAIGTIFIALRIWLHRPARQRDS